jgi:hypothetical protein
MSTPQTLLEWPANQLTATESSVEMVQLHGLCEDCIVFFRRWKALEWFQMLREERLQEWPFSSYLCTVARLVTSQRQRQRQCHFCTLILAALDRWPFTKREDVLNMNVYLRFQESSDETLAVNAIFAQKQPESEGEGTNFAGLIFERYFCMSNILFPISIASENLTYCQYPSKEPSTPTSHPSKSLSTLETT